MIQIPDFAGFWILSTFVSLPTNTFLLYTKSATRSVYYKEKFSTPSSENIFLLTTCLIVQSIQLLLVISEILIAFSVIRDLSQIRAKEFHLNILIKNNVKAQREH